MRPMIFPVKAFERLGSQAIKISLEIKGPQIRILFVDIYAMLQIPHIHLFTVYKYHIFIP